MLKHLVAWIVAFVILARCGPLVADHRRLRIKRRQATELEPAQNGTV